MINQNPRSHAFALLPLVSTRFQILFHSLAQGSFHLSLTVLSSIGRRKYLALRDMVHADSHRIPRVRCYSGLHTAYHHFTLYRTLTSYGPAFQPRSAYVMIYPALWLRPSMFPLPRRCNAASFDTSTV